MFEAEVKPRTDIQALLAAPKQLRRARRNRKTRYRQARFLNRKKPERWLAPSVQHKATIRKGGKRQRHTAPKYVHGFRLFDCVCYQGKLCFVFGRRSSGYFELRLLDGTWVHASVKCKKFYIVQKASALLVERRAAFPPAD